ncbi:MAG: hypothetical protein OER86_08060 [Phycisphaerae bacterium]|nr:hypothetical protein [Phycisphaerae bacterium]
MATIPSDLWAFLPIGYAFTIAVEVPILLIGLSKPHPPGRRLAAGIWLTAVTYPIVVLVLPILVPMDVSRATYLIVAETFAPLAECLLFYFAFHRQDREITTRNRWQDYLAITLANLASFGLGELWNRVA